MTITLPDLPYAIDALEPTISRSTLETHHGKHHRAYVDNLNKLIAGTALEGKSLEEIVKASAADASLKGVFNNAAQVWNHTFYWNSLKPKAGGEPTGAIAERIAADFGSYAAFREKFAAAAVTQFGSGWAWLVVENGKLAIVQTGNAATPITGAQVPLLTLDVWEHAYYIDYKNRRPDYVAAVIDTLLNWDFANENLAKA